MFYCSLCHIGLPKRKNLREHLWVTIKIKTTSRGLIKGRAPGKLTGCERDLAINLPGCFRLLLLLSFIRKTKNARL